MYKQVKNTITGEIANCIIRLADNACIPFDPDNTDYQAYLQFLADGGEPLPAENT